MPCVTITWRQQGVATATQIRLQCGLYTMLVDALHAGIIKHVVI